VPEGAAGRSRRYLEVVQRALWNSARLAPAHCVLRLRNGGAPVPRPMLRVRPRADQRLGFRRPGCLRHW
jgi:hypothetical protein